MQNFILGTAGHIDHGKTSLIKAITGIDTDRLEEEKKRGISIVLGYASIHFQSGISVGIVDVPGHAKFIKTMVSGSTGMDGVLLAVAADDGIMAQTAEHLLILQLLGISMVIPVITKSDRVDGLKLMERKKEISDFMALYGYSQEAPGIAAVSVKTGKGINELKGVIERTIVNHSTQDIIKINPSKVFMPLDRVISMKGFGTVLAGTLKYGSFSPGDEIEVMPSGATAKVKSIESHGRKIGTASKSMRIAVNVPSIEKDSVKNGDVIASKESLTVSDTVFAWIIYAGENKKDLKNRSSLLFMTGGISVISDINILGADKKVKPGNSSFGIIKLKSKISSLTGERFILRDPGAGRTLGGGLIIDPDMDFVYYPALEFAYKKIISGNPEDFVAGFLEIKKVCDIDGLYKRINLNRADFLKIIFKLKEEGIIFIDQAQKSLCLIKDLEIASGMLFAIIERHHKNMAANGLTPSGKSDFLNMFLNDFRFPDYFENETEKAINVKKSVFEIALGSLLDSKKAVFGDAGAVLPKDMAADKNLVPAIPREFEETVKKIEEMLQSSGNSVPDSSEIERRLRINKKTLNFLLSVLVKEGRLVKIKHDLYYLREQIETMKAGIDRFFEANQKLFPADMKAIAAVSRKYAIPLLEYFDYSGYTVKREDYRIKPV